MILVADIGTTFCKCALINEDGHIACNAKSLIKNHTNTVVDTSDWLDAFKDVLAMTDAKNKPVDYIIVSGNGPTLAPSQGGKALLYTHCEAEKESDFIFDKTGIRLLSSMFLPKALFIKNNNPALWNKTECFLSTPEFLSYTLTGVLATFLDLEGLEKWYWNDKILNILGLEQSKFAPFIKTGQILGTVTRCASETFGLKQGTPVLAGCPDFVCAIVGSGAMHSRMVCNRSGSSEGINYCSEKKTDNPAYMCYRHPNKKDWNISYVIPRSGIALEKAKSLYGFDNYSYDQMFSYIIEHDDKNSKAIKEVCTSICQSVKTALDNVANSQVSQIRVTGGPSKSDYLNQLRADITQTQVCALEVEEAGLLGLGVIAISAMNNSDISSVSDNIVKVRKTYYPSP